MTDTINNVPCELLETLIEQHITAHGFTNHTARQAQLILCAPSPAGVDGLEVVGTLRYFMDYPDSPHSAPGYITHQFNPASWDHAGEAAGEHKLCRLSDAQAIIDGLRGDLAVALKVPSVAAMHAYLDTECAKDNMRLGAERDQQAQRIGELEGLLREERTYASVSASCRKGVVSRCICRNCRLLRIDAALSSGKEGE